MIQCYHRKESNTQNKNTKGENNMILTGKNLFKYRLRQIQNFVSILAIDSAIVFILMFMFITF